MKQRLRIVHSRAALPCMTNTRPCAGDGFKRCSRFVLRWFTPAKEVPLCGHATLASAAALWTGEGNAADTLHFDTVGAGPDRP